MPSKKKRLPVYLTDEEYAEISASATRAGISLSRFAKLACTGIAVPTLEHKQAVQEIIKARADLGRLGGLFKQGRPLALVREVIRLGRKKLKLVSSPGSGFDVDVDDWGDYEDIELPL